MYDCRSFTSFERLTKFLNSENITKEQIISITQGRTYVNLVYII